MAKKAATFKVHQLAKELGVDSKVIIAKCHAEDIPGIDTHLSPVSAGLAATIREWFSTGAGAHNAAEIPNAAIRRPARCIDSDRSVAISSSSPATLRKLVATRKFPVVRTISRRASIRTFYRRAPRRCDE